MNTLDTTPLPFGKYKGQTPEYIADFHPSYIVWLYDTVAPKRCSKALALACEADERDEDEEHMYGLGPADHLAPTCQEWGRSVLLVPNPGHKETRMIEITLANEATWLLETMDDCTNVGPCCYSCPHYDDCDHHYEPDEG